MLYGRVHDIVRVRGWGSTPTARRTRSVQEDAPATTVPYDPRECAL